jgi:FRG domain
MGKTTIGQQISAIREQIKGTKALRRTSNLADFTSLIHGVSEEWQNEDWQQAESDDDVLLNDTRLVGQAWFRGQHTKELTLKPGLYRDSTRANLKKDPASPAPASHTKTLREELFDLEHELRIDFTSYGQLLSDVGHITSGLDWYFLMQHHGLPTRLLDWTTNALAALFFALEADAKDESQAKKASSVAVWMIDAYWLSMRLSDGDWSGPLLPWSDDASKYVPPLEQLLRNRSDSFALVPDNAMPIEPPAIHPRVAAQEGRFIIFGRTRDLLHHRLRSEGENRLPRVRQIRFETGDAQSVLRDLAQLGVSRRTLFPDLDGLASFVRWKHFHKISGYNLELPGR